MSQRESVIDFYRAREILEFPDEASGVLIDSVQSVPDEIQKKIQEFSFVGKITKRETLVADFMKAVIPLMILGPLSIIPGLKYVFNLDIQRTLKIRMIE